jgi:hypothetical protein
MKRFALLTATMLFVLTTAPVAMARADAYYTVVCDGVRYESVDALAVEQGGKAAAVADFGEKHDMDCRLDGPFAD